MALVAHQPRPTRQVFEDHLEKRRRGLLEEDLAANYAEDVVLLTVNSNGVGHDAIRHSAARLDDQMPTPKFEFVAQQVNGRFALLIWRGYSSREGAIDGADTFVIENGLIRLQTIHYRLVSPSQRPEDDTTPG
ncbi:MAG: nuclear transport factor 2 family protein [Mesorhizobium sp.]